MTPDGSGARILTSGGYAEGPSWAPNGRAVMFTRGASAGQLWYVDVASGRGPPGAHAARRIGSGLVAVTQLGFRDETRMEKNMTKRLTSLLAMAAALSLTAGCATRRAEQRPPDPPPDHRGPAQ